MWALLAKPFLFVGALIFILGRALHALACHRAAPFVVVLASMEKHGKPYDSFGELAESLIDPQRTDREEQIREIGNIINSLVKAKFIVAQPTSTGCHIGVSKAGKAFLRRTRRSLGITTATA